MVLVVVLVLAVCDDTTYYYALLVALCWCSMIRIYVVVEFALCSSRQSQGVSCLYVLLWLYPSFYLIILHDDHACSHTLVIYRLK